MAEDRIRVPWLVVLIVALHMGLAIGFASVTPYRGAGFLKFQHAPQQGDIGAPDERQHANYIQHLLDGKGLPVFDPKSPNLYESYQSHQPPLFYVVGAAWAKVTGVSSVEDPSAGFRLRLLNVFIGGFNIAGVFFLALWGRRSLQIAFGAAAFAALLPMNLALSGAISNDPLLFALCTWTLALLSLSVREGWNLKRALCIGLLAGLAMLTKTTAVALIPVLILAFWLGRAKGTRLPVNAASASLVVLFALALPWWLRNQQLYGDPFALGAFNQAFAGSPKAANFLEAMRQVGPDWMPPSLKYWTGYNDIGLGVGWWTLRSFFGVFGYMDIFMHSRIYAVLGLLLLVVLAAALWPDHSEETRAARVPRILGRLFFLFVLAFFLKFNAEYFQAQARYLLPAIGPISVAIGIGLARLGKSRPWMPVILCLAILFSLDIGILAWLPAEFQARLG